MRLRRGEYLGPARQSVATIDHSDIRGLVTERPDSVGGCLGLPAGDGGVVELRKKTVVHDGYLVEELGSRSTAFDIVAASDFGDRVQAGCGCRAGDEVAGYLDSLQHHAPQGTADVAEQTVFDRVVLGATGRLMSHFDAAAQLGGQAAEILLEPMVAVGVAATAVAQQQETGSVPVAPPSQSLPPPPDGVTSQLAGVCAASQKQEDFVLRGVQDAVWNQPLSGRDDVLVLHMQHPVSVISAQAEEIAQRFLFLGVQCTRRT
jgi:hypothetical protein